MGLTKGLPMNTAKLSDHAESVLDGYWTLCSPYEAVQYFVEEYIDYSERNRPFLIGDDEALNDKQVIAIVAELLAHFNNRSDAEQYVADKIPFQESRIRTAIRNYVLRKRMKR